MREILPGLAGNAGIKEILSPKIAAEPPEVSHAYIIEGAPGSGRTTLAVEAAAALVCERRSDRSSPLPCRSCPVCRRIFKGIHPDVIRVAPDEGKRSLGIDAVRTLREEVFIRPVELDYKFVIISDADKMTVQAQNALLLTLEEPPSYTLFFLIVQSARALLETVVSRSQTLRTSPLTDAELEKLLTEKFPEAKLASQNDPAGFRAAIETSGGYAGAALEALSEKKAGPEEEDAERFIELAADPAKSADAALILIRYASKKREELLPVIAGIQRRAAELLAAKAGAAPEPDDDSPAASYSMRRLYALCNAATEALAALQASRNARLTVSSMLKKAGIAGKNI